MYDSWSLPIFRRELDVLYQAFCLGKDSPLPELTVQLAILQSGSGDISIGMRALSAQLAYWRKQLSGNLPVLRLGCERPSELPTASLDDVLAPVRLSRELSAKLKALTKREGTTLFITFLTALKALINVSTGQNDIMLGVYMAKETLPKRIA